MYTGVLSSYGKRHYQESLPINRNSSFCHQKNISTGDSVEKWICKCVQEILNKAYVS